MAETGRLQGAEPIPGHSLGLMDTLVVSGSKLGAALHESVAGGGRKLGEP